MKTRDAQRNGEKRRGLTKIEKIPEEKSTQVCVDFDRRVVGSGRGGFEKPVPQEHQYPLVHVLPFLGFNRTKYKGKSPQ